MTMTAPLTASMPAAADALPLLPEIVLVAGAFALLILDLFIDKPHKIVTQTISVGLLLAVLVFNLLAATQDIVTDGLAVRLLAARERGLANAIQVGAYRLGMILGAGACCGCGRAPTAAWCSG